MHLLIRPSFLQTEITCLSSRKLLVGSETPENLIPFDCAVNKMSEWSFCLNNFQLQRGFLGFNQPQVVSQPDQPYSATRDCVNCSFP